MKLIGRISLRLSLVLAPILVLWAAMFYFKIIDQINDETDDSLEDYSEVIIIRMLANKSLPTQDGGTNNEYTITPVSREYAMSRPHISYCDRNVYIHEKGETEPARVLTTIFQDAEDQFYELTVSTPTFEREDLYQAVFTWIVALYFLLLLVILGVTVWVLYRSMRPLYALLEWLDGYTPGLKHTKVPNDTSITEFRKLNEAAQKAIDRSEHLFEQQKQFIGNASHELQTPLAVLGNRIDWLIDRTNPTREQLDDLIKMHHTLNRIVKMNKALLLLTKIDNGQFPENSDVDLTAMINEQVEIFDEIYASNRIVCQRNLPEKDFVVRMNPSLASTLVGNLLKNAYLHTEAGGSITVSIDHRTLVCENDGLAPLDADHIFDRFYQGTKKEGSTGLGLALVKAICRYYGLQLSYEFRNQKHRFTVTWP